MFFYKYCSTPKALGQSFRLKCHLVGVELPGRGFMSMWSLPYMASDSNLVFLCTVAALSYGFAFSFASFVAMNELAHLTGRKFFGHACNIQTITLLAEALRTMETPPASLPPTLFWQVFIV
jgi:hypothetical protein